MKVSKEQFSSWCESGFKEFGGTRQEAISYGLSVGLRDYDVSVIRKIAGLASHTIQPYKVTPAIRAEIIAERSEGKTIRAIAKNHNLSVSIVHRIIHSEETNADE
jgi:Mor family transcriptional regulator